MKELKEEIQLPISSKWKSFFSIGGKIIFLENSVPSSTPCQVMKNWKIIFRENHFPQLNTTLFTAN